MIDIHCHILPGVDDGARDIDESIAMARRSVENGVTHIIATPHFNSSYLVDRPLVIERVRDVQAALDRENIPLTILPGNEVRIESIAFVKENAEQRRFCYLGNAEKFILLEQKWSGYNEGSIDLLEWFKERGVTIIVPHPERHFFFRDNPDQLLKLLDAGAWTQVSVDSLLGKNSPEAQTFAEWLLENDRVHTLATDAHNTNRKPNLAAGVAIVKQFAGERRAEEILRRMGRILHPEYVNPA